MPFDPKHPPADRREAVLFCEGNAAQSGMVSAMAIRESAAVDSHDLGGASMPQAEERNLLQRTARYFALAAAGAGLGQFMAETSQKADGALIQNASDRPAAIAAAQPLLAVNGGPEATAEITGTDGVSADVGVTMLDATSFVMMAHTLTAPGDMVILFLILRKSNQ